MSVLSPAVVLIVSLALGYLCGAIPFGLLLTRRAGMGDVRAIGSGNIGATNVLRTGRKDLAAATLLLDALKGTAAVLVAGALFDAGGALTPGYGALAAGLGAFLGHIFPVWLKFRGGKGVATFIGVLLGLSWPAALVFAAIWLGIAGLTRFSSAASLTAALCSPIASAFLAPGRVVAVVAVMAAILMWTHRANIGRLRAGTEGRIGGNRDWRQNLSRTLDDAQKLDWLQLIRSDNVGPRTFRTLINRFGGARAALEALPTFLRKGTGERAIRIATRDSVEREWAESARRGIRFVALGEPTYPSALRAIDAPPPILAVRGADSALRRPAVAVVGSRNASAAGLAFAERLARGLGEEDFVTVSGLARGIDAAVHRASLRRGTIAVLAGGHGKPYPPEHVPLLEAIIETGLVVSEMPLEWEPRGRDFPRRNRIVSGLALGTVVVEAARRSGSLITARFASEQGREVFSVPGSPLDPRAEGTNDLLRDGATLCTRVDDVVSALKPLLAEPPREVDLFAEDTPSAPSETLWDETDLFGDGSQTRSEPGHEMDEAVEASYVAPDTNAAATTDDAAHARIVTLLGPAPVSLDDLVRLSALRVGTVQAILLDLELAGQIERHGGNLVSLSQKP